MRRVELAVRQAEGVAGEQAAAALVPHAVVVPRVAGCVEQAQGAIGQVQFHAVGAFEHALGAHRHHRADRALHLVGTVDGAGTGDQFGRIDQVTRAQRVHDQPGVGQRGHQRARTTGVVQVHVRGDHPVDRIARHAGGFERVQQARHRVARAGVDEGGAAALDHQVRGIEVRPLITGVNGPDAVAERG